MRVSDLLPVKPPNRARHASTLPKLLPLLNSEPIRVVVMDANVLVDLTDSCARAHGPERSALLEQLHAGRLRVFISHQDVAPVESLIHPGVTIERIERSMERYAKLTERRAATLHNAWRTHLRPWTRVLDPTGLPVTDMHADVTTRDPDDADLTLITELLGADAFLSRDGLVFGPTSLPVLPSVQRQPGDAPTPGVLDIIAAWRNAHRVRQHTTALAIPPAVVGAAVRDGVTRLSRVTNVHPVWLLTAGLAVGVGLYQWLPADAKVAVRKGLRAYLGHALEIQPTKEERAYDQALRAWCELPEWPEARDFRVVAARHLARARTPVNVTELAELGGVTPRTAGMRLRKHPGLFHEWPGGLWSMVPCPAEREA